jgi:hypothetical protein
MQLCSFLGKEVTESICEECMENNGGCIAHSKGTNAQKEACQ